MKINFMDMQSQYGKYKSEIQGNFYTYAKTIVFLWVKSVFVDMVKKMYNTKKVLNDMIVLFMSAFLTNEEQNYMIEVING